MARLIAVLSLLFCSCLVEACPANGGGILYAFTPEIKGEFFPIARLSVQSSENFVSVSDNSIEHNFLQTFANDNEFPLEAIYLLPISEEAQESQIEVSCGGVSVNYKVLNPIELQGVIKDLVYRRNDQELLELWGARAIVIRSIHLEARNKKTIRIRYTTPTIIKNSLMDLKISLIGERYSLGPVGDFSLWVKFKMGQTVRTNLCLSHPINIAREGANRRLVSTRDRNKRITEDFQLLTSLAGTEFDLRIFNHEGVDNNNYFLLMLEPPTEAFSTGQVHMDMDVAFLIDCSGSVDSPQLDAARSMVLTAMERLKGSDKFDLISFGSTIKKFSGKLRNVSKENIDRATIFLQGLKASGGSDLFNAITSGLELFNARRRGGTIILFTDGRPTIGVTGLEAMTENVRRLNKFKTRIFVVSLGEQPNILLAERLAAQAGGKLIVPSSHESVHATLDRLFSEITTSSITDISVDFQDMSVEDVFPESTTNMSGKDTLFILGRYGKSHFSSGKIVAKAKIKGKIKSSSKAMTSANVENKSNWIEMVWAMRKLGKLVEKEMIKNDSQASDRLSYFCNSYGFVDPLQNRHAGKHSGEKLWTYMTSFVPTQIIAPEYKIVRDRLFKLSEGTWIDKAFKPGMPKREFTTFGEEFFSLLKESPDLAICFCLGPNVIVVKDGVALSSRGKVERDPK